MSKLCSICGGPVSRYGTKKCKSCYDLTKVGNTNPNWRGGLPKCPTCGKQLTNKKYKTCLDHRPSGIRKRILHNGYYMIYKPEHQFAGTNGYIKEHRWVMEEYLGRILERKEIVHHINHIKTDNRKENLMILTSSVHTSHHSKGIVISDRQKKIISQTQKGNKHWLGKKHSENTKQKMSESAKQVWKQRGLN